MKVLAATKVLSSNQELVIVIPRVFDQLNKCDEKTPRVRPVHNQPLHQHARDLLLYALVVRLDKEVEEHT